MPVRIRGGAKQNCQASAYETAEATKQSHVCPHLSVPAPQRESPRLRLFSHKPKKARSGRAPRVNRAAPTSGFHMAVDGLPYPLVTTGCGYLPTGYLPTGYLPNGYLPIGAAATGGGSLRGKSAAAATLNVATSAAVTIMTIFMMLIPLCWTPGRADRVTPLFRFVCARRPLLPSHVPAQPPGEMAPDYLSLWAMEWFKCDWENREECRLTKWSHASRSAAMAKSPIHCRHSFT